MNADDDDGSLLTSYFKFYSIFFAAIEKKKKKTFLTVKRHLCHTQINRFFLIAVPRRQRLSCFFFLHPSLLLVLAIFWLRIIWAYFCLHQCSLFVTCKLNVKFASHEINCIFALVRCQLGRLCNFFPVVRMVINKLSLSGETTQIQSKFSTKYLTLNDKYANRIIFYIYILNFVCFTVEWVITSHKTNLSEW